MLRLSRLDQVDPAPPDCNLRSGGPSFRASPPKKENSESQVIVIMNGCSCKPLRNREKERRSVTSQNFKFAKLWDSLAYSYWFSPLLRGVFYPGFPLSSKTNISKFQFDQESGRRRTTLWMCYLQIISLSFFIIYKRF